MTTISHLPQNDKTNGWSRILPERTPHPELRGDVRADFVVVGAGWAGLGAARRLAENEPDARIILVDAGLIGENASGRNSGFAIDLPHGTSNDMSELEHSHRYMRLARGGIAYLEISVQEHDIACNWSRRGKYQTAVSARGMNELLTPFASELDKLNEPYRWLDARQCADELGTPYFHAAIHTPGCVLLNPAALCRGLGDNLPGNVTVHENSPVIDFEQRNGISLKTPAGSIYAPTMILAVNGFAPQFGFFKGRLLPFHAHASLSRQLTEAERDALGGVGDWGVTPVNAFVSVTMRYTQDHRILIRQDIGYSPGQRTNPAVMAEVQRHHKVLFDKRFPMLPDVGMEHTWTGYVCLSRNNAPGFGQVAPNVYAAVCQNAIGVAKGTMSGLLAADMACGRENELIDDMVALGSPARLPPRPFLDLGVIVRNKWDLWRSRHEA